MTEISELPTELILHSWRFGQTQAERLCAELLILEGFHRDRSTVSAWGSGRTEGHRLQDGGPEVRRGCILPYNTKYLG